MGTEVVLGGLIALAIAGVVRLVPTGIGLVIAITAGIGILRAVIEWELRLRRSSDGSLHRDRVVSLAVFTLVLFAASIGISALVPGIVTLPSTPSARPDPVGPLAVLAVGIGSAAVAALLAAAMSSLRRERTSAIVRDALGAAALNGAASILFATVGVMPARFGRQPPRGSAATHAWSSKSSPSRSPQGLPSSGSGSVASDRLSFPNVIAGGISPHALN
jgi:hypothetical protein